MEITVGKVYKNLKHGTFYTVFGFTRHSETQEVLVTYDRLDPKDRAKIPWSRPAELFGQKFVAVEENGNRSE